MSPMAAPKGVHLHPLLAERASSHAFDEGRAVESHDLAAVLEAARSAASWDDQEPWRFLVLDRSAHPEAWAAALGCMDRLERPWAHRAAVLIAACADGGSMLPRRASFETGGAAARLCLEATARGLAVHSSAAFDATQLQEVLGIPAPFEALAVLALGHRADLGTLGRDVYHRETRTRRRLAVRRRFFAGVWGRDVPDPE
jgi:nitroreductase